MSLSLAFDLLDAWVLLHDISDPPALQPGRIGDSGIRTKPLRIPLNEGANEL